MTTITIIRVFSLLITAMFVLTALSACRWEIMGNNEQTSDYVERNNYKYNTDIDIENSRINLRFPHVSDVQEFLTLDNGTLVDKRLLEAWTEGDDRGLHFNEDDLWFIFDLIIRHFGYINDGDEDMLFSTMMGQDVPDSNVFHPLIVIFMAEQKGTSLFVERIELSSVGSAIRVIVSNSKGDEFHIWPLLNRDMPGNYSWRINRYINHIGEEYWTRYHPHLIEYNKPFFADIEPWKINLNAFWATGNYDIWEYSGYFHMPFEQWPINFAAE